MRIAQLSTFAVVASLLALPAFAADPAKTDSEKGVANAPAPATASPAKTAKEGSKKSEKGTKSTKAK